MLTKGDIDKAIADFNHALELKPGNGDALTGRGLARLRNKDYARALDDLNHAIASDGGRIASYTGRAAVYEAQGNRELAIADLRKASELKPKSVFDLLAQVTAKQRAQQLRKQLPCSSAGARWRCMSVGPRHALNSPPQ